MHLRWTEAAAMSTVGRRRPARIGGLSAGNGGQWPTASAAFMQLRQRGFCNLQILKELEEFESHPLRQSHLGRHGVRLYLDERGLGPEPYQRFHMSATAAGR